MLTNPVAVLELNELTMRINCLDVGFTWFQHIVDFERNIRHKFGIPQ